MSITATFSSNPITATFVGASVSAATQAEVDAGTVTGKYVSPDTLANSYVKKSGTTNLSSTTNQWKQPADYQLLIGANTGSGGSLRRAYVLALSDDTDSYINLVAQHDDAATKSAINMRAESESFFEGNWRNFSKSLGTFDPTNIDYSSSGYYSNYSQTGNITFTIAGDSVYEDVWKVVRITSNGTGTFSFDSNFETGAIYGVSSGGTLAAGAWWFYFMAINGKVHVNVPGVSPISVTAPTLSSAVVADADTDLLTLTFSVAVTITTAGWSLSSDGGSITITGVSDSGTTTPDFALSRAVVDGETITISYDSATGATAGTANGTEVEDITDDAVTNNVAAPTLSSAVVSTTNPNLLVLTFDAAVTITTAGWTIASDGAAITVTAVEGGDGTTTPDFTLSRNVVQGETLTISYTPGVTAKTSNGALLVAIVADSITNSVDNPDITAASVEDAEPSDFVFTAERAIAGTTAGWTPKINGTPATKTGFSGSGTTTITITVSETVENGDTLTFDYSGGNMVDTYGNVMQTITGQSVTNNVEASIILFQDTFTGSTIDAGKWTAGASVDIGITQSNELLLTDLTNNASAASANINCDGNFNRNITGATTVVRIDIDDSGLSDLSVFRAFTFGEPTNQHRVRLQRDGTAPNSEAYLYIRQSGSDTTTSGTGVALSGSWKIILSGGTASAYRWNGSVWGSALASGSYTDATDYMVSISRAIKSVIGNVWKADNVYVTNADFSTLNPV